MAVTLFCTVGIPFEQQVLAEREMYASNEQYT